MAGKVQAGGSDYSMPFPGCYGIDRVWGRGTFPRPDFHEDEVPVMAGNYVDLAQPTGKVRLQDAVSVFLEVFRCQ
jgi:hypothetical protein